MCLEGQSSNASGWVTGVPVELRTRHLSNTLETPPRGIIDFVTTGLVHVR
jgi:hypothetical protein